MKKTFSLWLLLSSFIFASSQNYLTRTAHINLNSANKFQNIVADNYQVACQLNVQTGEFKIIALVKSFEYQIGAMNRVMNNRNIDVTDYPKITFDGIIENLTLIRFNQPGTYPVKVKGILSVWDEKTVTDATVVFTVKNDGSIEGKSNFTIAVEAIDAQKIDMIMREKLPVSLNLPPNTLGISKNIEVLVMAVLKKQ